MALAFHIAYGNLVGGLTVGSQGWLNRTNALAEVPDASTEGAVSITYISLVTAAAIVDGTVITNNTDSVTVAGAFVDSQAAVSLKPSQAGSFYTKRANMDQIAEAHADAFYALQQNALIADLIASTPLTGAAQTLTIGQIDFATDGTDAEVRDNLAKIALVVAKVQAAHQNKLKDLSIVMAPAAYGNFTVLLATGVRCPIAVLDPDKWDGAMYTFMNVPVFVVDGATNFTGADNHCVFVTSKKSVLLARKPIRLHNNGLLKASDGTTKLISICPFAHAVITGRFGEVINPSS